MTLAEKELFSKAGFTQDQIEEIDAGMKAGLNVSVYVRKDFLSAQMHQIRLGLMEKLPVEIYAKPEYDWFQMEEIRKGLKLGVDVSVYAFPEMSYEIMREIRKGLVKGINLTDHLEMDADMLKQFRKSQVSGVNLVKYICEGYNAEQVAEIREALEKGLDIDGYLSKEFGSASIAEIRKGLENGIDVAIYAKSEYTWEEMREIRKGLENRLAVDKYSNGLYTWEQMREIRKGLEQGLNVDEYCLLTYTAEEMRIKRLALSGEIDAEDESIAESVSSEDFMFEFSAGNMEAYITVLSEGKEITREKLLSILEKNNIRMGIVEDAVEKITSGRYGRQAILIAQGRIPFKGKDGWYEFFFNTNMDRRPKKLRDGSVDYQNIEWFEKVQEGWEIAYYHEAEEGTDGYSVKGDVIKARKGFEQKALKGKGFRVEGGKTYIATVSGMVRLDGNEITITDHMVLDEVNLATGNVRFDGSVHVLGNVCNGTVINASGDVVVDGNVEAATITSGGSVVLKKGMNSSDKGMITAEKDVVSRFFEAVTVVAKGSIEVDRCLNSQLYAGEKIVSTKVLAGGIAQAEKGFRLNHVGNQAGLLTVLKLKVNETDWEENKKLKAAIREVGHELQLLIKTYEGLQGKIPYELRSKVELFVKVEKAVAAKRKQYEKLLNLNKGYEEILRVSSEAKTIIFGQAYEGTILEMNGGKWLANNQRNITIKRKGDETEVINN